MSMPGMRWQAPFTPLAKQSGGSGMIPSCQNYPQTSFETIIQNIHDQLCTLSIIYWCHVSMEHLPGRPTCREDDDRILAEISGVP